MKTKDFSQLKPINLISVLNLVVTGLMFIGSTPAFSKETIIYAEGFKNNNGNYIKIIEPADPQFPMYTGDGLLEWGTSYNSSKYTARVTFLDQTGKDTAAVLLKCIDLTELQKFYPEESDGSLKPICIMQYPVAFSLQQDLNFKGKKALFLTRPMIYEKKIKSFFLFHNLEIIDNKANVTFEFDYYSNSNLNVIKLNVVLLKTGDIWNVTETKNIGR